MEAELRIDDGAAFRVAVHGQGVQVVDELRHLVEKRLRTDLRSYARRIVVAHVRLWVPTEADNPAICHVRVELRPSGGLALGETGSDLRTAVARAVERMRIALGAQLARPGSAASQAWLR
jgi:ribosome-associated translation inhibitor RaiA